MPAFGYKNHVSIDRRHGPIRRWCTAYAAAYDGAKLRDLANDKNRAKNEAMLAPHRFVSPIHRKKPLRHAMEERTRRANARKSAIPSRVELVFAYQKRPMGIFIGTIGFARTSLSRFTAERIPHNPKHYSGNGLQRRYDSNRSPIQSVITSRLAAQAIGATPNLGLLEVSISF